MALNISFYFRLMFICFQMCGGDGNYVTTGQQGTIETACRDRYFWVSVYVGCAGHVPRIEAIVETTVHIINKDRASMCGYTLNNLDGRVTLRASYFSCITETQNNNHFLFKLNVVFTDDKGKESKCSLSETCTLTEDWSAKEVICAENYVEVTVAKDTLCTSDQNTTNENWAAALALARRSAISEWQVMFLNSDNMASMSISDARRMGYMVDSTPNRVVFRAAYNQPHSTITQAGETGVNVYRTHILKNVGNQKPLVPVTSTVWSQNQCKSMGTYGFFLTNIVQNIFFVFCRSKKAMQIDGIDVEVIDMAVFFRQKWAVVMLDTSAACTIGPSSFDGVSLHWRTPKLISPLVPDRSGFISKNIELGVEAQLLDEATWSAMGYILAEDGNVVYASVPFAAPGGYRRSLVENNTYKESYMVFLCYQHIFSHMFTDGTEMETRHRQQRVLETPLVSRIPFTIDETLTHKEVFTVYLGNFAPDVQLIGVKLNENYLEVTDAIQQHYFITKLPYINGTHGIIIKVPFVDQAVNGVYLGEGVLQYSLEITYTLNIIGQNNTFYHHVSVVAQVHDAFPPDITAVCTAQSIIFVMNHPTRAGLWEVFVGQQTLTTDLSRLRGYILKNDSHSMSLEAPLFTSGYVYENVTLRNFVGIFELLIRDSKTLEIHSRTAKRCFFQTYELTLCSPDGMMTVVANTTKTWPTVKPSSTTLLDRRCKPKSTDETRVMFTFGVTTCGARLMNKEIYIPIWINTRVGDAYIAYENEIVSERGAITDQGSAITRESKFRLTVRCFYPLNSVFTARLFEETGFGTQVTDTTGPQENLISSHTASVFKPNPWPDKPRRSCAVTDKHNTQLLKRGDPHAAYYSANQGRKTPEHSYHGNDISNQHRRASQTEKSGPQTAKNYFYEGLFKNYQSSLVDIPQQSSPEKWSGSQENLVMTGDDDRANDFYKTSKNAQSITDDFPVFLQSPIPRPSITSNPADYHLNGNKVSDRLDLKQYMDRYTANSSFQRSLDMNALFNNNLSEASSHVDHTNKTQNAAAIGNNENIFNKRTAGLSDQGQKQLGRYIFPTFNIHREQFESHESSAKPFKEGEVVNGLQVHHAGTQNNYNFMYEDTDYSAQKLSKILQRQEENKDRDFLLFKNKPVIFKSSKNLRRTFFEGGGTSRYGPSVHDGILRG